MTKQLSIVKVEGGRVFYIFNGKAISKEVKPERAAWIRHAVRWRRVFRCTSCYLRQSGGCGCCSENKCVGCGRELFNTALNK